MLAGTRLGSHGPEQNRLMEGSKLAWISETAVGEMGQISRLAGNRVPRNSAHVRAGHIVQGGWLCRRREKHPGPHRKMLIGATAPVTCWLTTQWALYMDSSAYTA